jgi:hypothetical protein
MDMSFMAKFIVEGRDAGRVLDRISANSVDGPSERITYTQWLNAGGTLEADLEAITAAVAEPEAWVPSPEALAGLLASGGEEVLQERWCGALAAIDQHWDRLEQGCRPLASEPVWRQRWRQGLERLGKLKRLIARRPGS